MKLLPISTALATPALFATVLSAQTFVDDLAGTVSAMNINLTIRETVGGNRLTDEQVQRLQTRGVTIPLAITYDTTFTPGQAASAVRNPSAWDITRGNNYVERVSSRTNSEGNLVVTAEGSHRINVTRFTNATLLQDLVGTDRLDSARGYRLVAVRFETSVPEVVYNNGTYLTVVNDGLYFFAERGADDPAPIFLGAENDRYDYEQVIDFESFETVEQGSYTDTFTGTEQGFAYDVLSDAYRGVALAEISIYRPSDPLSYYELRVGGTFNWTESYNRRRDVYVRGPIVGRDLAGPGNTYVPVDTDNDSVTDGYEPTGLHEAVITGTVSMPGARNVASLQKYMDRLPGVLNP